MSHREVTPLTAEGVRFEVDEAGVATITLARPERKNPLTFDIYAQLTRLFHEMERDDRVKTVVLRGGGHSVPAGTSMRSLALFFERSQRSVGLYPDDLRLDRKYACFE